MSFTHHWTADATVGLGRLYAGEVFLLPANEPSVAFQQAVLAEVIQSLGEHYRQAHSEYEPDEYFDRIGKLRKRIFTSTEFHQHVRAVIESLGFPLSEHVFDPGRLRVVAHNGHLNPAAAPIYHGHRDTWYSNPQSMITWWIPLHDVSPPETFDFFPKYFLKPVQNDSETFDFGRWTSKGQQNRIGWQNKDTGRKQTYPRLMETPDGEVLPVQAHAGEILLFSGQHLHQTRHNVTGQTRFSIDFRTVRSADDEQGIGPENIDNRSSGSSIGQFVKPCES